MNDNYLVEIAINLTSILFELVLLGVFIYYVVKRRSLDGILLLTSSILSILIRPLMYFGYNYLNHDVSNIEPVQTFTIVIRIYGLLNTLIFTIGIVMLVFRMLKEKHLTIS